MKSNAARPLVMVTLNGQVEYVNDAFLETLGWSRDAVINVAASSLLSDIPKAVLSDIQKTVRANRPWIGYLAYRSADARKVLGALQYYAQQIGTAGNCGH